MKVFDIRVMMSLTAAVVFLSFPVQAVETDQRIETSAQKSYVFTEYLKDDAIKTQSKDGVVTLTGTVKDPTHKSLAQETVENLPGVKRVDNQLVYKGEEYSENSDGWLSMKVKSSLLFNRNVSAVNTQVFVKDGVVTLMGEAQSQAQKDLTAEHAKDVHGVKSVKNEMTIAKTAVKEPQTISGKIDDASITAQVKMAFLAHHSTSAFKTGVQTMDGVVTLTGVTTSGAGKDMATKVANDVVGVRNVINNMTINEQ